LLLKSVYMDEISKQLREAIDVWGDPLFLLNADLDCVYTNIAFCQLLGLSTDCHSSFPIKVYWPAVQGFNWAKKEFVSELINVAGRQLLVKISTIECSNKHRLCRILCASSKDENMINFHAQRLETLGMLAGGVAHDFNNILTGILGHITYLKTILPASGSHVESLTAIEDGARRASTVTQEILNFSRIEVSDRAVPVELGALINRTCTLLRGAISPRFEMEWHVAEKKLFALVEESKMAQVLINLVINSRDAIAPGGHIRITLNSCDDLEILKSAFRGAELLTKHYCCLAVSDDGHGIPTELLGRIFEPYFSTKKEKGTGLGLATVKTIVGLFGGAIDLQSMESNGTVIKVYLPLLDETMKLSASQASRTEANPVGLLRGTERVLIVDDEHPVRNVLSISLEHLGYSVEAVASGPEAIALLKEDPKAFDLIILDMLMPQMSGKDVFCQLKELNPNIRVLAISGFTSEESIRYILDNGGKGFIQKPFTIEDLSKKVRACF